MKITLNGEEVTEDDMFMQISIGADMWRDKKDDIFLMIKNPAGLAKFPLSNYTNPLLGGCLTKEKTIKLCEFLCETLRLWDEHENNNT